MRKLIAAIVIIIIIVIAWLAFGGNNSSNNNQAENKNTSQQPNQQNTTNNQSTVQPVSTNQVTINNLSFSPTDITVKQGTKVTWTNQDSTSHTITENDGKTGPDSPLLANGQSYSFTYNETGTFKYHCTIHPEMTGTVTVTE